MVVVEVWTVMSVSFGWMQGLERFPVVVVVQPPDGDGDKKGETETVKGAVVGVDGIDEDKDDEDEDEDEEEEKPVQVGAARLIVEVLSGQPTCVVLLALARGRG